MAREVACGRAVVVAHALAIRTAAKVRIASARGMAGECSRIEQPAGLGA
jgi:hypothetical protein